MRLRILLAAQAALIVSGCSAGDASSRTTPPPCWAAPGALTIPQAKRATPGASISVVAWLWEYRPPVECNCPPNTPCAACPEIFHIFGDAPAPRSPLDPAAFEVELPPLQWRPARGVKYLMRGFHHGDRPLLTVTAIAPLCR